MRSMTLPIRNARLFLALLILGSGVGLAPLIALDADPFSWKQFLGAYTVDTDLSISKDDGVMSVSFGDMVTYTIEATNLGPDPSTGATVSDTFPSPDLSGCSWTCSGMGGGSCPTGPVSGDINASVDLPVGATVTFLATCTVSMSANGMVITNTATIAAGPGEIDASSGNNTASDTDTMVVPVELMTFQVD
ncbi:MAG: DUF11 domain-containing protein [Acidobacteriota bacterium]